MAWWLNLGVSEMAIDPDVRVVLDALEARVVALEERPEASSESPAAPRTIAVTQVDGRVDIYQKEVP